MCNRYDSERAAEEELAVGCTPEMEFLLSTSDIAEIEAARRGRALSLAADEKAEIDVDNWEQEGGAL